MIKLKDILNEKHIPGHDKEGKMAKFDAKETYQDAMDVFKMIDEYDDLPESAFYMVGSIEEAVQKAEKMAKDAAA